MKRALIITYYWPPSGGAGVQRWLKFVKYLRGYGWEPAVYTPENPESPETDTSLLKDIPQNLEIIRRSIWEPYAVYKRLLGQKKEEKVQAAFLSEKKKNPRAQNFSVWIRGNFFIPDARKFWIRPSVKFLVPYLKEHPVDLIVSTGPPHSMHLIARDVASATSIPWLADFRDPWTQIDFYKDLKLTSRADATHRKMEKSVLRKADAITVISPTMASDFRAIHQRDYEVITNGFDEDDILAASPEPDKKFSIAHIGTLTGTRNPDVLWQVLSQLITEEAGFINDLQVKLVGKADHSVITSLEKYGLTSFIDLTEYLPHDEVTLIQQSSQVLLLLINNTSNSKGILTGKFFEYLAARRPILCIGPTDGDAARILNRTNAGLISGFKDTERTRKNLLEFYHAFKTDNLKAESTGIEEFSRKALTGKMAALMDTLISRHASRVTRHDG